MAQTEMRTMLYSFLNCGYNNDVNNGWVNGYSFDTGADTGRWYTGLTSVTGTVSTAGVPTGKYDLFLSLPDAASRLAARPEYAIRLANAGLNVGAHLTSVNSVFLF